MQQGEESATEAEFGQDEYLAAGCISACSHEVDQVCVPDLDQSCDLSLELFGQVVLPRILAIVRKLKLFDGDIILLVCGLEDISTCSGTYLLFKSYVADIYAEVIRSLLELHVQNIASLLSLCHLGRVMLMSSAVSASYRPIRLTLLALCLGVRSL